VNADPHRWMRRGETLSARPSEAMRVKQSGTVTRTEFTRFTRTARRRTPALSVRCREERPSSWPSVALHIKQYGTITRTDLTLFTRTARHRTPAFSARSLQETASPWPSVALPTLRAKESNVAAGTGFTRSIRTAPRRAKPFTATRTGLTPFSPPVPPETHDFSARSARRATVGHGVRRTANGRGS
jgi:hypothetical protein